MDHPVNAPLPLHLDLICVGQLALELAVTRMVVVMTSYCFRMSSTTLEESLEMTPAPEPREKESSG